MCREPGDLSEINSRDMLVSVLIFFDTLFIFHTMYIAQFGWRIEEEWLQSPLNLDTTLDYFITTTTGHGACTFALVHYLTYVHNEFIDWCRATSKTRYDTTMCGCLAVATSSSYFLSL